MDSFDIDGTKKEAPTSADKITIKTGVSSYSFTQSWVENKALKDILVGMVVDDYNLQNHDIL